MRRKTYPIVPPHFCDDFEYVWDKKVKHWVCPVCRVPYSSNKDRPHSFEVIKWWKPWLLPVPPFSIDEWKKL